MVEPIPAGYHNVTPYLMVRDAVRAIAFYRDAFGATEVMRFNGPDGRIAHAEVKIGDSHVMLADEVPDQGSVGPQTLGGAGVSLMLYVNDVDATFAKRSQRALPYAVRSPTSSMAIAWARSPIRSVTSGRSERIAKTFP